MPTGRSSEQEWLDVFVQTSESRSMGGKDGEETLGKAPERERGGGREGGWEEKNPPRENPAPPGLQRTIWSWPEGGGVERERESASTVIA